MGNFPTRITALILSLGTFSPRSSGQVCDPTIAPANLISTYTPGSGALLQWDAVPGSVGVQLKAELPTGINIARFIIGSERDQYFIPDFLLSAGNYTWRVLAACSTEPPYSITPISAPDIFSVTTSSTCPVTVNDVDGNSYETVEIGSQCWMAENLKVEHYRDGVAIPTGIINSAWGTTTSGAFAIYDNDITNKTIYGLLYNWHAVNNPRNVCPADWHVPSDAEWTVLTGYLGGPLAGGEMKTTGTLGAGTGLWKAPNTGATNSSGFSGLPVGYRYITGVYGDQGNFGYHWSSTAFSAENAWFRSLYFGSGYATSFYGFKQNGFAVRCLKD